MTSNRVFASKQKGFSNIQIMLGVLISAIMLLGGLEMYHWVDQAKIDADIRDLTEYKKKTKSLAARDTTFAGVNHEVLIDMDFFGFASVIGQPGSPRVVANRWGGSIYSSVGSYRTPNDSLLFTFSGVPSKACKQLGLQAASLADAIQVSGTWVKWGANPADEQQLIVTCDSNPGNAAITFFFSK